MCGYDPTMLREKLYELQQSVRCKRCIGLCDICSAAEVVFTSIGNTGERKSKAVQTCGGTRIDKELLLEP